MPDSGIRWEVQDRYGNWIYLSHERWNHIIEEINHPEIIDYEEHLKATLKKGKRQQEPLNPRKYRYNHFFENLPTGFNHVVVIVLFSFRMDSQEHTIPNNYVTTAFLKYSTHKG